MVDATRLGAPGPFEPPLFVREATDGDGPALADLIGQIFAEYPGCVLDLDEMPELRRIASTFRGAGGAFSVLERRDPGAAPAIVACVGLAPADRGAIELKKLYVAKAARRSGVGSALCALVEGAARRRGASAVELWSDTRFLDAHRLYERRGYVRGPDTRALHDKSNTVEYFFRLAL